MFITAKSFAQTASTCSNPYVMNLTNGAGNGEFQFHYPDTVMYVKLTGVEDKQNFEFTTDTSGALSFQRVTINQNSCSEKGVFDDKVSSTGNKLYLRSLYFNGIDTILIILTKNSYSISCNYCDTANLKFSLNISQPILPDCSGDPRYCGNLVRNGDFEQFAPQLINNNGSPTNGIFIFPDWGTLTLDGSITCGWDFEWFDQSNGLDTNNQYLMETSPFYISEWFDQPNAYSLCTLNIPLNYTSSCNSVYSYGFAPQTCHIQPQQINNYFPNSSGNANDAYMDCWLGTNSVGWHAGSRTFLQWYNFS